MDLGLKIVGVLSLYSHDYGSPMCISFERQEFFKREDKHQLID